MGIIKYPHIKFSLKMPATLTLHGLIGCEETQKVFLTVLKLGLPVRFVWMTEASQAQSKEFLRLNQTGSGPALETDHGNLRDSSVILRYLCNLDTRQNLAGRDLFERAQCDEWLAYASSTSVSRGVNGSQGTMAMTDKERSDFYGGFPKALVPVEQHFKSNTYFCGEHMTIADLALVAVMWGGARGPKLPEGVMKKMPNLSKWYNNMIAQDFFKKAFGNNFAMKVDFGLPDQAAVAKNLAGGAGNKKAAKKASKADKKAEKKADTKKPAPAKAADDDFDLFGDETEEDKVATEALKKKSEAAPVKKEKKVIIAKSLVVFDIKGYEVEADWEAMATKVRLIEKDGLVWMDTHKVLPVAFGMKKLQMSMLIEDDKIETEDVFEIIESWEEDVQSTDIFSFNKA